MLVAATNGIAKLEAVYAVAQCYDLTSDIHARCKWWVQFELILALT